MKSFRSVVFQNANYFLAKGICRTFPDALRLAWAKYRFVQALRFNELNFRYITMSGSLRHAVGTIKEYDGYRNTGSPDLIRYFDVERQDIRCFKLQNMRAISNS